MKVIGEGPSLVQVSSWSDVPVTCHINTAVLA